MTLKDIEKTPLGRIKMHMEDGKIIDGYLEKEEYYYILSNERSLNGNRLGNMRGYKNSWVLYSDYELRRVEKIEGYDNYKSINLYNLIQYKGV